MTYQKPLPNESVYKHLMMLVNYLNESAESDNVFKRQAAKKKLSLLLTHVAESRAMLTLLDYCE